MRSIPKVMSTAIKKLVFFFFAVLCWYFSGTAQESNPLKFLPAVSQSSLNNPAQQNQNEKLVVGLPLISGSSFNWNSNFAIDYIFSRNFAYSFDNFYKELGEPGDALATLSTPLVYLSLKKDQHNFTFSVYEKIVSSGYFDHEILQFIDLGLQAFYGDNKTYGPVIFKSMYYREMALGYSNQIWEGLTIGIRPKILFARFFYDIPDFSFDVETREAQEQLALIPHGNYTVSAPVEVVYKENQNATYIRPNPRPSDYFFNFRNLSPALDLGILYHLKTGTEISMSIIDLGFLGFKHNTYKMAFMGELNYEEDELYQSKNPDATNYKEPKIALQELSDSIPFIISADLTDKRIIQQIPLKFNASLKQKISPKTNIGISGQYTYFKNNSDTYFTGFMHTNLGDRFDLAATFGVLNFKKILPGVGFSYTGQQVQYYLSTNNITGFLKPASAKYLNLSFGVNFLFSTTEK